MAVVGKTFLQTLPPSLILFRVQILSKYAKTKKNQAFLVPPSFMHCTLAAHVTERCKKTNQDLSGRTEKTFVAILSLFTVSQDQHCFFILYFSFFIIILYQDGFDQHESGCLGAPWSYQALLRSRSSGPHQVKRKFHLVCQKYDDAFNRVLKRRDRCLKKFIGKLCINSCVVYL